MSYVIATRLVEQEKLPITCKYLEGSRFAWRMAEFYLPDSDPIGKICVGGVRVTLRRILKRGGLTDAEAGQIAALLQLETSLDEPLSYADTVAMKPKLAACGQLLSMIRQHAGESYEATLDYFRQEGLLEKQPFGIVDSGWVGSLQQTLGRLLTAASGEEPGDRLHGFYFGLYELPHGVNKALYHTFYFRPYRDIEKKVRFSNCLYEAVCSAAEGMTIGYRRDGQRIAAVYETQRNPNEEKIAANEERLNRILAGTKRVREQALPMKEVRRRLERLMCSPTREEADCYGSWLFSDDVCSDGRQTVAAALQEAELWNLHPLRRLLIMKGVFKRELKDSAWPEGSAVSSGSIRANRHLRAIRWYKRAVYMRKRLKGKN